MNPAVLMLYFDRRMSPDDKGTIAALAPWVQDYATTKYVTPGTAEMPASSAKEFGQRVADGGTDLLDPAAYQQNMAKNRQFNQAWAQYAELNNLQLQYRQATGVSASSPQFKQFKAAVIDKPLSDLLQNNRDWATQFATQASTSFTGLTVSTRPLRSLMNWEVIPQFGEFETAKTQLWRRTMVDMNDAASAIHALSGMASSAAVTRQKQQIFDQLTANIQGYAQQDPAYAAEIRQFKFQKIEDLVNLDSMSAPRTA